MNVDAGAIASFYPPNSLLSEEEKWKTINYAHMNSGGFDTGVPSYTPENTITYYNQSNVPRNTIYNDGGSANIQNIPTGFSPNVKCNNSGFGGFSFNPRGLFTTNYHNPPSNTNTINDTESNMNYPGFQSNSLLASTNANSAATMTNGMNSKNTMGNLTQMYWQTMAPSPALPDYASYPGGIRPPMPMACLTPDHRPISCPPPPESPMFLDSHSYQRPTDASIVSQVSADHEEHRVTPVVEHDKEKSLPSSSRFLRGIGTVSSALGTVAGYVNQGLLLGIPFHIADRAMKESKGLYSKWWDQEVGKKRKSDGVNDAVEDRAGQPAGKKRRLDSSVGAGSTLTLSLTKNYENVLIETCSIVQNKLISASRSPKVAVDSSIIKPRRGLTKPTSNLGDSGGLLNSDGGCNAFNDIGGMYDFGLFNEIDHQIKDGCSKDSMEIALTSDSSHSANASICKPRRGLNNRQSSSIEGSIGQLNSDSGYNAFNDIGGMYDFDGTDNMNHHIKDGGHNVGSDLALTSNFNRSAFPSREHENAQSERSSASGNWGNLDGTMKIIGELIDEKNRLSEENELFQMVRSPRDWVKKSIRSELIEALDSAKGDVHDKRFLSVLEILSNFYKTSGRDARVSPWSGSGIGGGQYGYNGGEIGGPTSSDFFEGSWVNMSRPNYIECLGENGDNDFMYTLGRMSFDMFQPSNLICSVQSTHTTIKIIGEREELPAFVPKSLKEEVASLCDFEGDAGSTANRPLLRSYDIAVSMTIEPPSSVGQPETPGTPTPTKRMRAVMSVKGYVLPDRTNPNRLSVWFTGGQLAPARLASNDDETVDENDTEFSQANSQQGDAELDDGYGGFDDWAAMFAKGKWRKSLGQRAKAMAAKLLLGAELPNKMDEEGQMNYVLHRPVGGHGKVYVDVLYLDEDILIMRGHHGTMYAMARSCVSQRYLEVGACARRKINKNML